MALCETCGKKMTIAARGPTPMWCSPTCCQAARRTRRQSDTEVAQKPHAQHAAPCSPKRNSAIRLAVGAQEAAGTGHTPSASAPKDHPLRPLHRGWSSRRTAPSARPTSSTRAADLDAGCVPRPAARRHSSCANRLRSASRSDRAAVSLNPQSVRRPRQSRMPAACGPGAPSRAAFLSTAR